ncbi:MAG: thioesterase [Clostridium sp.]|nr:thioesterase [Clostridium sp.]
MSSEIKLYTLPFAGGSSFSYMPWKKYINSNIKLINLDYPGHGKRIKSSLIKNFSDVVLDIVEQIQNDNKKKTPFIIYGHSMGGMIAYLSSVILTNRNMCPSKVIIGACRCPEKFSNDSKQEDNYASIVEELLQGNRITEQIAKSQEFNTIVYPIIKNDFEMMRDCDVSQLKKQKLNNEIICLYGENDKTVQHLDVIGWNDYTEKNFICKKIKSGHFFVEDNAKEVCEYINELIVSSY